MIKHKPFTLIEITLALGVVAVGVVAILGLFPVGSNATRDAIGFTHAAESADNFLQLVENYAHEDWTFLNSIPGAKPTDSGTHQPPLGDTGEPGSHGTVHAIGTGLYQVVSFHDNDLTDNRLGSDAIVDFNGVVAIWKEDSPELDEDNNPTSPNNRDIGVLLKAEVSWPAQRPYDGREKEIYALELFNR